MTETQPSIRVNIALGLAAIGVIVALWGGLGNLYRYAQAEERSNNRITTIENDRAREASIHAAAALDNAATLAAMATRTATVEEVARTAANAAETLKARVTVAEAAQASNSQQLSRFSEALAELSSQQAVTNALLAEIKDQLKGLRP